MDRKEERRIDREIHDRNPRSDPFAAAMRATRMPMVITDPRQADNPIVFVNDAFTKLTGYSREETLGRNCRFLQGPGTNLDDVAKVREAVKKREPVEIDLLNYRKDGSLFWNRLLVSPVFNGGELSYFFASQLDVTRERTAGSSAIRDEVETIMEQRIADLTASEERLHFTLKAGGLGTWTLELPQRRLVASAICKANFGRSPADTFTYEQLAAAIHPDDVERWATTVADALADDGDLHVEYRVIWPDGSTHWIEIRAQTRFDTEGNPVLMSGVSIDITGIRQAEETQALMAQELSHRIKNLLATVQSIVAQSMRAGTDLEDIKKNLTERINALGRSQDILTGRGWDVAEIRATVERAVEPFNQVQRIRFSGPDVGLNRGATSALMLALHELATNAVKYGALSNESGKVLIEWAIDGADLVLTWTESGGPMIVAAPTRKGFGSRMIERVLASTIRGTTSIEFHSDGVRFKMRAALSDVSHA